MAVTMQWKPCLVCKGSSTREAISAQNIIKMLYHNIIKKFYPHCCYFPFNLCIAFCSGEPFCLGVTIAERTSSVTAGNPAEVWRSPAPGNPECRGYHRQVTQPRHPLTVKRAYMAHAFSTTPAKLKHSRSVGKTHSHPVAARTGLRKILCNPSKHFAVCVCDLPADLWPCNFEYQEARLCSVCISIH